MPLPLLLTRLSTTLGLPSLARTGRDAYLLIGSRTSRMIAHAAAALVLPLFLSALSFSDAQIGLFLSLTLAGDVLLSLLLALVADRLGRRRVLVAGAALMAGAGAVFVAAERYAVLLGAAVVGVMSATGGDVGPFRAVEESTLAHLTGPETRADVLAWYVTLASVGAAVGTEVAGRVVEGLKERGWAVVQAYHVVFGAYVVMGAGAAGCALAMSGRCEVDGAVGKGTERGKEEEGREGLLGGGDDGDGDGGGRESTERDEEPARAANAVQNEEEKTDNTKRTKRRLFSQISPDTRSTMYKLWFLLAVDSLADGMVSLSLTYYYMDRKFQLSKSTLGDITSTSYILASCSTVFAGPLARHLGLINTMVFTHLPSSLAVLLFPIPQTLPLTVALFFLRTGLNNMDQAPRAAFIAAVVRPDERTAVMGITSMLRTLAATLGPAITGLLAGNDQFWIAFVVAGVLRIAYDLGLFAMFVNMKLYGHEPKEQRFEERALSDESDGEATELEPIAQSAPR